MKEQFKIVKPCNKHELENTPSENIFNCIMCKKEVIDLTHTTIFELNSQIIVAKNCCVKIRPHQLNMINQILSNSKKAVILSTAIATISTSCNRNIIQNFGEDYGKVTIDKHSKEQNGELSRTIEGRIVDASRGEPIIFAPIRIPNTEFEVLSDVEGKFRFELPENVTDNQLIQFDYIGYYRLEIEVSKIKGKQIIVNLGEGPAIGYLELINE